MNRTPNSSGPSQSAFSGGETPGVIACSCGKKLRHRPELVGKKIRCPGCQKVLTVAAPDATQVTQANLPSMSISDPTQATLGAPASSEASVISFLAPGQRPDELGRLGGYRVLSILGQGGMGVVFKAEDIALKRLVALKAMLPAVAASPTARERFIREAQAAAALKHDHIVSIFQVGQDCGAPFLAMEFLEGESLESLVKRVNVLPVSDAVRIGREIALGLAAAHKRGLIHRDIKPGNIWLDSDTGRAKILDFGLARVTGFDGDAAQLTQSGMIVGTPAYMPPEQASAAAVDHRCDLYSLGVLLYRITTGELPIKGATAIALLSALAMETPVEPASLNAEIPPELNDLIQQLLAKNPNDRPASARDVAEALEAIEPATMVAIRAGPTPKAVAKGAAQPAKPTAPSRSDPRSPSPEPRPGSWPRWLAIGGGGLAVIAAAVIVYVFWSTTSIDRPIDGKQPDGNPDAILQGHPAISPYDALRRDDIPPHELRSAGSGDAAKAPPELVAVFGDSRLQHPLHTFRHFALAMSPDGSLVASSHGENAVRLWDTKTHELRRFWPTKSETTCIVFSPDGDTIYAGQGYKPVTAWSIRTGEPVEVPFTHVHVFRLQLSRDGSTMLACDPECAKIWSMKDGQLIGQVAFNLKDNNRSYQSVALSPDGKLLLLRKLNGESYKFVLWNVADNGPVGEIAGLPETPVHNSCPCEFSPDGAWLAVGANNQLFFCDVKTRKVEHEQKCRSISNCLTFSGDSKRVAISDTHDFIQVFEVPTGKVVDQTIPSVAFIAWAANAPGNAPAKTPALATLDGQGQVTLLDSNARILQPSTGPRERFDRPLNSFVFALSDGFYTYGSSSRLAEWKLGDRRPRRIADIEHLRSLVLSVDGRTMYYCHEHLVEKGIHVLDVATGAHKVLDAPHDCHGRIGQSPDGKLIGAGRNSATFWHLATGKATTCELGPNQAMCVSIANDGRFLTGGEGLGLYQVGDCKALWKMPIAPFNSRLHRISPDETRAAVALTTPTTLVIDLATGKLIREFPYANCIAYSNDGKRLAFAADSKITVWDAQSLELQRAIDAGLGQVVADISFAPDNRHLIAACENSVIHVYRLAKSP